MTLVRRRLNFESWTGGRLYRPTWGNREQEERRVRPARGPAEGPGLVLRKLKRQ